MCADFKRQIVITIVKNKSCILLQYAVGNNEKLIHNKTDDSFCFGCAVHVENDSPTNEFNHSIAKNIDLQSCHAMIM